MESQPHLEAQRHIEAQPHIVVANEPRTYRDVLATELPVLRPALHVLAVDPADLDAVINRVRPLLVICSRMTEAIRDHTTAAILLYPDGNDQALVEMSGPSHMLRSPRLVDLLTAIDSVLGATETSVR